MKTKLAVMLMLLIGSCASQDFVTCTAVGQYSFCSDGTSSYTSGSLTTYTNGTVAQQSSNITNFSGTVNGFSQWTGNSGYYDLYTPNLTITGTATSAWGNTYYNWAIDPVPAYDWSIDPQ